MQLLLPLSVFTTCTSLSASQFICEQEWPLPPSLPPMCLLLTLNLPKLLKKREGLVWGASLDSVPVVGGRNMDELRRRGQPSQPCAGELSPQGTPQPFPVRQVEGTLLRVKRSVLIASAAERVGRHGSFRHCLKAGGDWRNCRTGPEGNLIKKIILVKKKKKLYGVVTT